MLKIEFAFVLVWELDYYLMWQNKVPIMEFRQMGCVFCSFGIEAEDVDN